LRDRGFTLAVATGKSRRGLDRELDETGLRDLFLVTRCADETRSKPHPQMLQDVLQRAGVSAAEAVMIGDTVHDLEMAAAASVPGVAVTYGVQSWEELQVLEPAHRIDAVSELLDLFG
jgi:phosphoglycolate phosphatase